MKIDGIQVYSPFRQKKDISNYEVRWVLQKKADRGYHKRYFYKDGCFYFSHKIEDAEKFKTFKEALNALSAKYPESWSYKNKDGKVDEKKIATSINQGVQIIPLLLPKDV